MVTYVSANVMDNLEHVELIADNLVMHSNSKKVKQRKFTISNPTSMEVAFKLCDTLPDFILMEPDHGYIKSHEEVTVTITILPFENTSEESSVEGITMFFCKAPPTRNVNVFTKDYPWPEASRAMQMVIKFIKNDKKSTTSSTLSESDIDRNENEMNDLGSDDENIQSNDSGSDNDNVKFNDLGTEDDNGQLNDLGSNDDNVS